MTRFQRSAAEAIAGPSWTAVRWRLRAEGVVKGTVSSRLNNRACPGALLQWHGALNEPCSTVRLSGVEARPIWCRSSRSIQCPSRSSSPASSFSPRRSPSLRPSRLRRGRVRRPAPPLSTSSRPGSATPWTEFWTAFLRPGMLGAPTELAHRCEYGERALACTCAVVGPRTELGAELGARASYMGNGPGGRSRDFVSSDPALLRDWPTVRRI